jgi:hypothetical protein
MEEAQSVAAAMVAAVSEAQVAPWADRDSRAYEVEVVRGAAQ